MVVVAVARLAATAKLTPDDADAGAWWCWEAVEAIAPVPADVVLGAAAASPIAPVDAEDAAETVTADAGPPPVAGAAGAAAAGAAETDDVVDDNMDAADGADDGDADDGDDDEDVWNRLAQVLLGCGGAPPGGIVLVLVDIEVEVVVVVVGLGTITTSWWWCCCCCFVTSVAPTELPVTGAADAVAETVRWGIASTFFDSICGGTTAVWPLLPLPPTPLLIVPLAANEPPGLTPLAGRWL